jgi:hypothetical protein
VFRRRRSAGLPLSALLDNYLVRAEAIADSGGGNLWVIEPTVPSELLADFTDAVVLHLTEHGVEIDGFTVLEGTSSARIVVLDAWDGQEDTEDEEPPPLPDVVLRPADLAPPAPRRPLDEEEPDAVDDVDDDQAEEPETADDPVAGVIDRAYESRSAR